MTLNISWDVDGVVLDLIGGFCKWLKRTCGVSLVPEQITHYQMKNIDPTLCQVGDLETRLRKFLDSSCCYQNIQWCDGVLPTCEGGGLFSLIYRYQQNVVRHTFLTATIVGLSNSLDSKMRQLFELFPDIPVINCPSKMKQMWGSDLHVDDRADICRKFWESGRDAFCIRRPWSVLDGSEPADRVGTMAECLSCIDSLIQESLPPCPELPYHHEELLDGR